ncbi:MAG: SulP family inorganic anion transporter [Bryobacteraceae bacterium]|jgi:high affinity sulfate transporter 1
MVDSKPHAPSRLRLFQGLRPLEASRIPKDILAGVTLAAMNIPQALGYTRIAGTPVVTGLYTLLLPLVAFAAFGSSRYLVVAADSATAAIMAGGLAGMAPIASARYVELAGLLALMTGACLLLARMLKLGFLADFLSQTVLVGFLTGVGFQVSIAVLGQVLGLEVRSHRTVGQLAEVVAGLSGVHLPVLGISAAVVACILACRRFAPRLPGPLIVVAAAIAASYIYDFAGHGISVIGPVTGGLPALGLPHVNWKDFQALVPVAVSCVVMIVAQSAATARAYAVRHQQRLDENADLVGLAAANVSAALSGTFVVDGSPTQTAMVERSGGQSQLAHLSTAAVVALVLLFLTGPLRFLPHCVLGAVVFTIAIGLIDWRGMRSIRRESPGEYYLALGTAAIVVLVGVEQGIVLAMTLSLLRIVRHSYHPHTAVMVKDQKGEWRVTPVVPGAATEPGLVIYRFAAPLFYANANRFSEEIRSLVGLEPAPVRWVVVDGGPITHIDYTAARYVRQLQQDLAGSRVRLAFAHVTPELRADLDRHQLTEAIGEAQLFDTLHEALAAIHQS